MRPLERRPIDRLHIHVEPARAAAWPLGPMSPRPFRVGVRGDFVTKRHTSMAPGGVRSLVRVAVHDGDLLRRVEVELARAEEGGAIFDFGMLVGEATKLDEALRALCEAVALHERIVVRGDLELELEQLGRRGPPRWLVRVAHDEGRVTKQGVRRYKQMQRRPPSNLQAGATRGRSESRRMAPASPTRRSEIRRELRGSRAADATAAGARRRHGRTPASARTGRDGWPCCDRRDGPRSGARAARRRVVAGAAARAPRRTASSTPARRLPRRKRWCAS